MHNLYKDSCEQLSFLSAKSGNGSEVGLVSSSKEHESKVRGDFLGEFAAGECGIHVPVEENLHEHNRMVCGVSQIRIRVTCEKLP